MTCFLHYKHKVRFNFFYQAVMKIGIPQTDARTYATQNAKTDTATHSTVPVYMVVLIQTP